ncbi:MAG TPA: glycosyltransferase [Ignavibacteriales bacterium]|nr:glycosyltransferase [Ignavibacteriales bacterium]
MAMVCGNNKSLQKSASQLKETYNKENLFLFGFVDFVYDLINASDIVITKGGASTFMEIISLNKFQIVTDYIWEQEKGNVEYLVENELGVYEPDIKKLPQIIEDLFAMEGPYPKYMENIKRFTFKNGRLDIAKFITKEY